MNDASMAVRPVAASPHARTGEGVRDVGAGVTDGVIEPRDFDTYMRLWKQFKALRDDMADHDRARYWDAFAGRVKR